MTTRLFLVLYASALTVAIAGEAPSVSGSVKDPQGRPVVSAAVSLYSRSSNTAAVTSSNSQGAYRFEDLAPGEARLRVRAPGFVPASRDLVIPESGGPTRITQMHDLVLECDLREQVDAIVFVPKVTPLRG